MIDAALEGVYIVAALAIPFLFGLVTGRHTKPDSDAYLESIGRTVNDVVGSIRSDARFTGNGCNIRTVIQLTVRNDAVPYTMTIERREIA